MPMMAKASPESVVLPGPLLGLLGLYPLWRRPV